MSTILLPAVRRDTANLVRYDAAGRVQSGTGQFVDWTPPASDMVKIADMGLAVGDVVSASAELKNDVPGESCMMSISARGPGGSFISAKTSSLVDSQAYTRHVAENYTIPPGAVYLLLYSDRPTGTGAHYIRNGMINRGPTAQPYDIPKRGALVPWQIPVRFGREHEQALSRTMTGVSQVTSYPSRRWLMSGETEILVEGELREWLVALDQLSDLANTFRHVVPDYDGPSTGYRGANPLVNGAGQLGTSLVCHGVDASAAIAKAGDYASFDVTSPRGNTNSQLFRLKSDANSDASGNVTFTFTTPIRQAPADNAVLQIFAPVAQFGLVSPQHAYDLQMKRMASLQIAAEERVLP